MFPMFLLKKVTTLFRKSFLGDVSVVVLVDLDAELEATDLYLALGLNLNLLKNKKASKPLVPRWDTDIIIFL